MLGQILVAQSRDLTTKNEKLSFIQELILVDTTLDRFDQERIVQQYVEHLSKMREVQVKSSTEIIFLEKLFYKTHRKLKHYQTNARFTDLLLNGNYDCVTGTALFASLLTDLGYDIDVIEFPFHTFLQVNLANRTIVFDSTDPLSGFITKKGIIAQRTYDYMSDFGNYEIGDEQPIVIDMESLIGLQYYNLSIDSFNRKCYKQSKALLNKAYIYYPSAKIKALSRYIAISE